MPTQTAWALIQADASLDSFEQIVNAAGMQGALESGSITVLAPASGAIGDVSSIIADQATAQDFVESHIISGSLDSNTPPYQAEEVRWGFPNSIHVIVENAGHESTLTLPESRRLMVDFLRGVDVSGRRIVAASPLR